MGLPAFAAPVDNFYLRWPRGSAHHHNAAAAAAASEPIPPSLQSGVDSHELKEKEPKMAENHLEPWDQPNVQNQQTCEIESQPLSSSSSECTDDRHVSKCGKDVSRQEEEMEGGMAHQERQDNMIVKKGSCHDVPADPTTTAQRVDKGKKDLLFPSNVEILCSSLVACCLCSLFIVISYGTNGDTTSVVASLFQ